jgi:hypothetical protein
VEVLLSTITKPKPEITKTQNHKKKLHILVDLSQFLVKCLQFFLFKVHQRQTSSPTPSQELNLLDRCTQVTAVWKTPRSQCKQGSAVNNHKPKTLNSSKHKITRKKLHILIDLSQFLVKCTYSSCQTEEMEELCSWTNWVKLCMPIP